MPIAYAVKEVRTGMYANAGRGKNFLTTDIPYNSLIMNREYAENICDAHLVRFHAAVVAPFKKQVLGLTNGLDPIYEPVEVEVASIHFVINHRHSPYSNKKVYKFLANACNKDTPFYLANNREVAIRFDTHDDAATLIKTLRLYAPSEFTSRLSIVMICTPMVDFQESNSILAFPI